MKLLSVISLTALLLLLSISHVQAAVSISSQSTTLTAGSTKSLYIYGTTRQVTWSSGNRSVAKVTSSGKVSAIAPGTATITAAVAGKKLYCRITVIQISRRYAILEKGYTKQLKVNGTTKTVTWVSGNKAVATVSSLGKVTAKAAGTATITASVAGKKLYCKITVLQISPKNTTMSVGDVKILKVYGTSKTVSWTSDHNTVATISGAGKVSAKGSGTVTITAAVAGIKMKCNIIVNKPEVTVSESSIPDSILQSRKMIGYYASWSRYTGFTPDKIEAGKLTHINYAFANIGSDLRIIPGDPYVDEANIKQLNALKSTYPNLKTLISVGGWTWSGRFSDAVLTEASRAAFADSCLDFLIKYGFDGVDIDWEYPVSGGLSTNTHRLGDKHNFTLLMKTLREKLDARGLLDGKHYILSFAGAAGSWYTNQIELGQVMQYADYVNVMTYDMSGTWDSFTGFNAPLYQDTSAAAPASQIAAASVITNYINGGATRDKIVMGVPFYGHYYQAVAGSNNGLYQTFSGGGSISYSKIASTYLNNPEYQYFYNSASMVPWLFNGSMFISFDDRKSIAAKAGYILDQGLSGAMIWELSGDPDHTLLDALYDGLSR